MPNNIWDWVKLIGPYLLEVLKVVISGPHKPAVENLRAKGILKDSGPKKDN